MSIPAPADLFEQNPIRLIEDLATSDSTAAFVKREGGKRGERGGGMNWKKRKRSRKRKRKEGRRKKKRK